MMSSEEMMMPTPGFDTKPEGDEVPRSYRVAATLDGWISQSDKLKAAYFNDASVNRCMSIAAQRGLSETEMLRILCVALIEREGVFGGAVQLELEGGRTPIRSTASMKVPGLAEVITELKKATVKFPTWPDDPLHALAVLGEEFGELTKEVVQATYEPEKTTPEALKKEAIQTAAMALRFVGSLALYRPRRCLQHVQGETRKVGCALCDRGDGQLGHSDECPNRYDA